MTRQIEDGETYTVELYVVQGCRPTSVIRPPIGFDLMIPPPARGAPVIDTVHLHSVIVRVTRPEGTHQKDDCCKIVVCMVELHCDRFLKDWAVKEWEGHVDTGKVVVDERVKEIRRGESIACRRFLGDFPLYMRV